MQKESFTSLAILGAAIILGYSGYEAATMWAPPKPVMVTVSQEQFFKSIDSAGLPFYQQAIALSKELGECQTKLPHTPTPVATTVVPSYCQESRGYGCYRWTVTP